MGSSTENKEAEENDTGTVAWYGNLMFDLAQILYIIFDTTHQNSFLYSHKNLWLNITMFLPIFVILIFKVDLNNVVNIILQN